MIGLALEIRHKLFHYGTSSLFAFQGISVNGYGQLILARIIVVLDLWLFGHFTLLPALGRSAFRLRQIDPILPKFRRPLSQSVLALSTFFGRRSGIDHRSCLRPAPEGAASGRAC